MIYNASDMLSLYSLISVVIETIVVLNKKTKEKQVNHLPLRISGKAARDIDLAIICGKNTKNLQLLLSSILNQTLLPHKVFIISNVSFAKKAHEELNYFKKYLPIAFYKKSEDINALKHFAFTKSKNKILGFVNPNSELHHQWVEKMISTHLKHPEVMAVQGYSQNIPKHSLINVIHRFLRQTWIRDNMLKDRKDFWAWEKGTIASELEMLDIKMNNITLKLQELKKLNLSFNKGGCLEFACSLLSHGKHFLIHSKILMSIKETNGLIGLIKKGFNEGRQTYRLKRLWPKEYNFKNKKRNIFFNCGAFLYFCLQNRYYKNVFILFFFFALYQFAFFRGKIEEKQKEMLEVIKSI